MNEKRPQCNRRSIRLRGYDYSRAGAYFVTICSQDRACLFGEIVDGVMQLNAAGRVARHCWDEIRQHFPHVELDEFVVMPNHIHGIIWIVDTPTVGAKNLSPVRAKDISPLQQSPQRPRGASKTIGSIVRGYKIGVT